MQHKGGPFLVRLLVSLLIFVNLALPATGADIPIPGNPKGDLPTELLQSLVYCRGLDAMLRRIETRFPSLAAEVLAAKAVWKYSPFAKGADYIEQDIRKDAGKKGDDMLSELEKQTQDVLRKFAPVTTTTQARDFLALVARRAKGDIEVPMVRGNLLWNCPEYQAKQEQELLDGYHVLENSTLHGITASVEWPMSWKISTARNSKILQKWTSHWGHGKSSGMLRIDKIPLPEGASLGTNEVYEFATREEMAAELKSGGSTLLTFKKTHLNGRPVLMMTTEQIMEQLGIQLKMRALVIMIYHGQHCITLQLMTAYAGDDDTAGERFKKNEPLFLMIANSLRLKTPPETGDAISGTTAAGVMPALPPASGADFEMYLSKEFNIAASLPKEVLPTINTHQLGTIGNFKAVDENRGSIYNLTVNQITPFIAALKRGETDWTDGVLAANFKGWTKLYPMVPGTFKHNNDKWQGIEAIRYSFVSDGWVEEGVKASHRGVTFLHNGAFYNISVLSLVGDAAAAEDLARLEPTILLLDSPRESK